MSANLARVGRRGPVAVHGSRLTAGLALAAFLPTPLAGQTYTNPLVLNAGTEGPVETCADPSVERDNATGLWVMVCTTDPLSGADRDGSGELRFRQIPTFTSPDLVTWTYRGDAFDRDPTTPTLAPPDWAAVDAGLWAPEIVQLGDRWHLLFAVTDVRDPLSGEPGCDADSAIGHAVSDSPLGPWVAAPAPLVTPRRDAPGCEFRWNFDPEVEVVGDRALLYYGSYFGGIEARWLEIGAGGALAAPGPGKPVSSPDRYEGAEIVQHDGWFVLMASAAACCNGPQTGYGVFAARSRDPLGPFLDQDGHSLLDREVGGTPVLMQSGNRWVGPGHNTVVEDGAGQWWTLYHAVEEARPFLDGEPGFTRRPLLLDRLDWVDGWPVIAGGAGPSEGAMAAPGAAPVEAALSPRGLSDGDKLLWADEFEAGALDPAWSWLRPDDRATLADGALVLPFADAELWGESNDAPVLLRDAPEGDFAIEAEIAIDWPEACCDGFPQAGLILYGEDDAYLKLVVVSILATRQVEFGREIPDPAEGVAFYGNAVGGPVGRETTILRLEVRRDGDQVVVAAWSRADQNGWRRGGTWRHRLPGLRLGLIAMGGSDAVARVDRIALDRLD